MPTKFVELPHSIEAEQAVLGALLIDNDVIDRIADLRAEHFYLGDHAVIFAEVKSQIVEGKSCDLISVLDVLRTRVSDCAKYLNELVHSTPSSANALHYSAIVRDKAIKRALIGAGRDIAETAINSPEAAVMLVDRATSKLEQLASAKTKQEPVKVGADLAAHISELEKRIASGTNAISTGYPDIDAKLSGGIRRGELIVLAARPKMGKTGFALNIACHVARSKAVLLLSMEMPRAQIHDRNIAILGRVPLAHLLQPNMMTDPDWSGLTHAMAKIEALNLYVDDQGGLRLLDVRMKAKGLKRKHGLDLLVIDYLQLMEGDGDNRNAQIEGITRGLKALAKELDIGIMLLSQLNRDLDKRPDHRPKPSDLRDSGAIEQDADAVIFLYRDEVYHPDTKDKGVCEVDVALCRQGAPGRVALAFLGEYTRFDSLLSPWAPSTAPERKRGLAAHL